MKGLSSLDLDESRRLQNKLECPVYHESWWLIKYALIRTKNHDAIDNFFHQKIQNSYEYNAHLILQGGAVGPGMFFVIPCTDEIRVMDLRTVSFDVPPQEILTKDSVTVSVDAVVYYNIRWILNQNL